MKNRHLLGTTALCAVALSNFLAIPNGVAQTAPATPAPQVAADSTKLEEVVVTARQRSEKEVDVPISIQAFTEAQIKEKDITDLNSLQGQAGFTFQQAASTQGGGREFPALVMRGLQSTYGGDGTNSGSVFVDGIYVSAGLASVDTADVSRIEVLKGPQNVYFGKNTFGGAINFITENPTDTFQGSIDTSGTMRGSSNVNAMIEGPLIPGLLDGRLTVLDYTKAAQYHTSDGGDLGAENTRSITGTLYATPSESMWFRFRGHYQEDDDSAADLGFIPGTEFGTNCNGGKATNASGNSVPVKLSGPYFCGTIPSLDQTGEGVLDQNTAIPGPFARSLATNDFSGTPDPILSGVPSLNHSGLRRDVLELSTQAGFDLPYNSNLAINLGYNQSESLDIWDLDRSTNGIFINAQPIISSDYVFDARLASDQAQPLRGLIGASYFHSQYEISQDDDNFYNYPPLPYYAGTSVQASSYQNETDETEAVYASVDYDIFSWLTATAEGRYQHDVITDLSVIGSQYSKSFNNILPRFIVKFHPEESWNIYASYSEGVQPAQLQTGFINATAPQRAYLETIVPGASAYSPLAHLDSWEIGAKQELLDDRLEYGIAVYDEQWNHQQTSAAVFNPASCGNVQNTPGCPLGLSGTFLYLSNNADVKGVEFNTAAKITDQWTADLSVDYKHAIWLQYYNSTLGTFAGGPTHFNGNELSRVPSLSGAVSSTYRDHLIDDWDWYAHGQMTYTGSMYESEVNVGKTSSYERVNSSIGFERGPLTLELYVKNLFDDKNWDWASRVPELSTANDLFTGYSKYMGVLVQAPDRRDIGIRVSYKFGATPAPAAPPAALPVAPTPVPTAPPPVVKPEAARQFQVFFDFDKSEITAAAAKVIQSAADVVKAGGVAKLTVTGHTDTVGSSVYNQELSTRRADAVKAALIKDGVPTGEITAIGVGKTGLLVPTADGVREAQNRRAVIDLK